MTGADQIEKNGFVARPRQAPRYRVEARIDRINDRARTEQAGEKPADEQRTPPHKTPRRRPTGATPNATYRQSLLQFCTAEFERQHVYDYSIGPGRILRCTVAILPQRPR